MKDTRPNVTVKWFLEKITSVSDVSRWGYDRAEGKVKRRCLKRTVPRKSNASVWKVFRDAPAAGPRQLGKTGVGAAQVAPLLHYSPPRCMLMWTTRK